MTGINHEHKKIEITCDETNHWNVKFEGFITRREVMKLNRVLLVEHARTQRQYSIDRKAKQRELSVTPKPISTTAPLETETKTYGKVYNPAR